MTEKIKDLTETDNRYNLLLPADVSICIKLILDGRDSIRFDCDNNRIEVLRSRDMELWMDGVKYTLDDSDKSADFFDGSILVAQCLATGLHPDFPEIEITPINFQFKMIDDMGGVTKAFMLLFDIDEWDVLWYGLYYYIGLLDNEDMWAKYRNVFDKVVAIIEDKTLNLNLTTVTIDHINEKFPPQIPLKQITS